MAVNRPYKKENGERDTDFVPVSIFGKAAEFGAQSLAKGSPILVWGRMEFREYEVESQPKRFTELVAENFQVLEWKKEKSKQSKSKTKVETVSEKELTEPK